MYFNIRASTSMAPTQTCNNLLVLFLCVFCLHSLTASLHSHWHKRRDHTCSEGWLNHGDGINNGIYTHEETQISPSTVSNPSLESKFKSGRKDLYAMPAFFNGTMYSARSDGFIYAVKIINSSVLWKKDLQKLTGLNATIHPGNGTATVSALTVACDLLIVGIYGPALVVALERTTGKLVWSTLLDSHPAAVVTMSGTLHNRSFYVGVSSLEEEEEEVSNQKCCTFRGSFAKLDIETGGIQWQTFMLPDNNGTTGQYAGAAVWGSNRPLIDTCRNHVYIATGNLYSAPLTIRQCHQNRNNRTVPTHPDRCVEAENHSNSVMALDLESGEIKWYRRFGGYDVWFIACFIGSKPVCPPGPIVDADFLEDTPMALTSVCLNGTERGIVHAVQKSGFSWALDPDNGNIVWWSTQQ
ncbi:unnamed protein product [Camellia sinensis]